MPRDVGDVGDSLAPSQGEERPVATDAKKALATRFVAAEALIPQGVVDDPERWAVWRRFDRLLTASLNAGDLTSAEGYVAEAETWVRDVSAPTPKELYVSATCPTCGGTFDGILYSVLGRPAVKCGACGTWELVRGGVR
jgi:hypothetical protein